MQHVVFNVAIACSNYLRCISPHYLKNNLEGIKPYVNELGSLSKPVHVWQVDICRLN